MSSSRTVQDSGQVGEYTENPRGTFRKKCASELALGWRLGVPRAMGCRGDLLGSRGFGGWVHDHFKTHKKGNDGDGTCVSGQKVLEHYRME